MEKKNKQKQNNNLAKKKGRLGWVNITEHAKTKQNKKLRTEKLEEHVNTTASRSGTKIQLLINEHLYTARPVCLNCPSIQCGKSRTNVP